MQARPHLIEDETVIVGVASAAMYLYTLWAYRAKEAEIGRTTPIGSIFFDWS
jgi:hypothetical protein